MDSAAVVSATDELTNVLVELVGPGVDLDDPVAVTEALDAAASGTSDRPLGEVAALLARLDAALAVAGEVVEDLGLEVPDGP